MQPSTACKLFGAYRSAISIKDSYVLLHTTIGCNWGTSTFHMPSKLNDIRQASTVIYNEDVVFGGEKIIKKAIDNIIDMYNPKILFIISGCVSGILGEDFEAEIRKYYDSREIIYIKAPGFLCSMEEGQLEALKLMVDLMKQEEKKFNSINLIGLLSDDYMIKADINNIKKIYSSLNLKLEEEMREKEECAISILKNIYDYIRHLYSVPCAVFDSISIGNRGYAGFDGAINLIEDLVNAFMTMDYRRKTQYM